MIAFSSLMVPALPHYKHKSQLKLSLNEKLFHSQLPTSSSTYDEIPCRPTRLWLSRKSVTKRKSRRESSASSTFRRKLSAAIAEDINHSKAFAPRKLAFKLFFANEISLSSRNWNKLISNSNADFFNEFLASGAAAGADWIPYAWKYLAGCTAQRKFVLFSSLAHFMANCFINGARIIAWRNAFTCFNK